MEGQFLNPASSGVRPPPWLAMVLINLHNKRHGYQRRAASKYLHSLRLRDLTPISCIFSIILCLAKRHSAGVHLLSPYYVTIMGIGGFFRPKNSCQFDGDALGIEPILETMPIIECDDCVEARFQVSAHDH